MSLWIFGTAIALYAAFWAWYVGFGRKISPAEIERVMARLGDDDLTPEQLGHLRRFLENDDGRDFVMVNAIHFKEPERESRALFARYGAAFKGPLFKRAGHPVLMGRAASAILENVHCDAVQHWSMTALVRYRSRADFADIATLFVGSQNHQWKLDAMEKTFAFPAAPWFMVGGPRWIVALVLALGASLVHIVLV